MNITGPFPGLVKSVQGTTPGPAPTYTIQVHEPGRRVPQSIPGVRPQTFWWEGLAAAVDEDAARMVNKVVTCYYMDRRLIADFVPPPLVGPCTGPESALIPALLDRIGQLELRLAKLEAAP